MLFSLLVLFLGLPSVLCLQCYYCHSHYSWQDCDNYKELDNCDPTLNTCYTSHSVLEYPNGRQSHHFLRTCFHTDVCNQEHCKKSDDPRVSGGWCQFNCCNTTLCNTVLTPWAKHKGFVLIQFASGGNDHVTLFSANHWCFLLVILSWVLVVSDAPL